jgi:hypothetical protein
VPTQHRRPLPNFIILELDLFQQQQASNTIHRSPHVLLLLAAVRRSGSSSTCPLPLPATDSAISFSLGGPTQRGPTRGQSSAVRVGRVPRTAAACPPVPVRLTDIYKKNNQP